MYEGFLVDLYVVVVIICALISLYIVSGNPKKRPVHTRTSVVSLLHGSSKPCIQPCVPRSKTVKIGIIKLDDGSLRPYYLKKYML